jgi:hypothetical protein
MSYADLPPNACYVPEMHLQDYYRVTYGDVVLLLTYEEFGDFIDEMKYSGVEWDFEKVQRTPEYFASLKEAEL